MIRHHRLLLAALIVLSLSLHAVPAHAVTNTELSDFPPGWFQPEGGAWRSVGVAGPAGAPLGTGSLRVAPNGDIAYDYMAPASSLEWSGDFRIPAGSMASFVIWTDTTPASAPTSNTEDADQVLLAEVVGQGTWTRFDLDTQSWFLDHVQDATIPETPSITWAGYLTANPDAVVTKIKMFFSGSLETPTGPTFHYLDNMTFTPEGGAVTTYDFEAAPAWPLATSLQKSEVPFGGAVWVYGALADPTGEIPPSTELALYQREAGQTRFTIVEGSQQNTNFGGGVGMTLVPRKGTSYQWRATSEFDKNIVSTTATVGVRRIITANVSDRTIATTTPMVVVGLTKSPAVGKTVTLRRTGSTTALGTATVHADGTYGLARKLPRGSYSLYVTIPGSGGLLSAVSPKIPVTIR